MDPSTYKAGWTQAFRLAGCSKLNDDGTRQIPIQPIDNLDVWPGVKSWKAMGLNEWCGYSVVYHQTQQTVSNEES